MKISLIQGSMMVGNHTAWKCTVHLRQWRLSLA